MPASHDDAVLVLAVRAGDEAAFTALFRRWSDRCFDVARRILHEDAAAADVAQETFVAAWRRLDSLRDPAAFGGWVLRMARNNALTRLERDRRATPTDSAGPLLTGGIERAAARLLARTADANWAFASRLSGAAAR